eukprot:scaffold1177_cov126-Isochrysis_galbana.AAC.1
MAALLVHAASLAAVCVAGAASSPTACATLNVAGARRLRQENFRISSFRIRMESSEAAPARQPLRIDIGPAGVKGMGAFAAEPAATGAWVCTYEGELLTLDQVLARYAGEDPAYLFSLGDGARLYLDGARGSHPSRYINHHQNGSLVPRVSLEDRRVDFFAAKDLAPGDELTFDCALHHCLPPLWCHLLECASAQRLLPLAGLLVLPKAPSPLSALRLDRRGSGGCARAP